MVIEIATRAFTRRTEGICPSVGGARGHKYQTSTDESTWGHWTGVGMWSSFPKGEVRRVGSGRWIYWGEGEEYSTEGWDEEGRAVAWVEEERW